MEPYISFVVAARNDNYGVDFNYRLENSINQLVTLVDQYKLPCEYIVVNYNPISDKPPLSESIKWPNSKYCTIRIITVSPDVHKSLENQNIRVIVPLYEYIAKNIGIRRANGEFICAANPDIMYSPEIIKYISKQKLKKTKYYRVDRIDYNRIEIDSQNLSNTLIKSLQKNSFRVFLIGNNLNIKFKNYFQFRFLYLKIKSIIKLKLYNLKNNDLYPEFYYHCNCSGDFMLMHKEKWSKLKGNPENTKAAVHTDSMFVIMAAMSGLKEKVFRWPIYHQNHDRRYVCDEDNLDPVIEEMYQKFLTVGRKMIEQGSPIINNNDNWGLVENKFDEEII
tara:strand:- start:8489 stop:9493 length:1005 start_codon:yes stop_codon:yes gene_type:complete